MFICILAALFPLVKSQTSVPVNLGSHFNAKAASTGLNDSLADFDGSGRAYPVEWLPTQSEFSFNGVNVHI